MRVNVEVGNKLHVMSPFPSGTFVPAGKPSFWLSFPVNVPAASGVLPCAVLRTLCGSEGFVVKAQDEPTSKGDRPGAESEAGELLEIDETENSVPLQ